MVSRYLVVAIGLMMTLWTKGLVAADGSDDSYAWLSVRGTQIVTSAQSWDGVRPFGPVGIGYARDVCIRAPDDEVMQYCKQRYLNTVRLAFYVRYFNNVQGRPIKIEEHLRDHCDPVIAAAKKAGLYVILDDHEYFHDTIDESKARQSQRVGLWDDAGVQQWIDGWVTVAKRYKDEPFVMGYELLNEPHDLPPEKVREWYGRCIKAIRQVDQRHIIMVGSTEWSHARSLESTWGQVAKTLDAPVNQVVFIFHDYPKDNEPWIVQRHVTTFRDKHGVPVLCTEFGALPGPLRWKRFPTGSCPGHSSSPACSAWKRASSGARRRNRLPSSTSNLSGFAVFLT